MAGGCSIISLCTLCNGELKMFPSFTSDVANSPLMVHGCPFLTRASSCEFSRLCCLVRDKNTSSYTCTSKVMVYFCKCW